MCIRDRVIVNPTAPIGDHDIKPTPTGRMVLDFLKGDMPAFIDTGLNVVDARDVALGQLLACERGRAGERYILGSENLTLAQILGKLAAIAGRPAPTVQLPYAVAYAAGVATVSYTHLDVYKRQVKKRPAHSVVRRSALQLVGDVRLLFAFRL